MKDNQLQFKNLVVRRAPGFSTGMSLLNDLDSDVVVVAGPNGSGKSTIARILREVYHPDRNQSTEFECSFILKGRRWTLFKTTSQIRWTCDGEAVEPDFLPAATLDSRYMLAMHDLLRSEDANLADSLYQASVGGFDIDAATKKLGYATVGKDVQTGDYKLYKERSGDVEKAQSYQAEVKARQAQLGALEDKKKAALKARAELGVYTLLKQRQQSRLEMDEAANRLESFPPQLDSVNSDDAHRYASSTQRLSELQLKLTEADRTLQDLASAIRALKMPEGVNGTEDIPLFKALRAELILKYDEADRVKAQVAELQSSVDKMHIYLGTNTISINRISSFIEEKLEVRYRKLLSIQEQLTIRKDVADTLRANYIEPVPQDAIQRGIIALSSWLQTSSSDGRSIAPRWIFALAASTVIAAVAGWFLGAVGISFALLIAVLSWFAVRNGWLSNEHSDVAGLRQQDFRQTGLAEPEEWTKSAVTSRLNNLMESLQQSIQASLHAERLRAAESAYESLKKEASAAEKAFQELADDAGIDASKLSGSGSLYEFLRNYVDLQQTSVQIAGKEGQLKSLHIAIDELIARVTALAAKYNKIPGSNSRSDLLAIIDSISETIAESRNLSEKHRIQADTVQFLRDELRSEEQQLHALLEKLSLSPDEGHRISDLTALKPSYLQVVQARDSAKIQCHRTEQQIREHPYFESLTDACFSLTLGDIDATIASLEATAGELEEISRKTGAIEQEVSNLISGHGLEEALTHLDNAKSKLQLAYNAKVKSVIGDVIARELKQEAGNTSVPEVMRTAQQYFARITAGRYELHLKSGQFAGFKALDTLTGTTHTLDELSSGTRIQLLLSVRLAFVEVQEQGVRLPIFADELLANSDDVRAEAVIDTLLEIARTGRQVFYFTAQSDEIDKWMHKFGEGVSSVQISLGANQREPVLPAEKRIIPTLSRSLPNKSLPLNEYIMQLDVPKFDLAFSDPANLHVSYLTDDVELLNSLLENHIDFWSQVENLYLNRSLSGLLDEDDVLIMQRKVSMLQEAGRLLQTGRNKPVGIQELEQSNAISPTFMDTVIEVLEKSCNNDPGRLIESIDNKAVKRFPSASLDKLKEFFESEGYIAEGQPLSENDFRLEMSTWLKQQGLSQSEFDTLIKRFL